MKLFLKIASMNGINRSNQSGYSLIEVMTGVTIFAILTLASVNLFLNTTIGSTKDNSIRKVKQNGDHILGLLENSLRSAQSLEPNQELVTCQSDMRSISLIKTSDSTLENWYVQDNNFYLNGELLLDESIKIPDNRLFINCRYDAGSKATFIEVIFNLEKGTNTSEDSQNHLLQEFKTSVSVRNKL